MEPINNSNIWTLYRVSPHKDEVHKTIAAKFLIHGNDLHVLENHSKMDFEGDPGTVANKIKNLSQSPYYQMVNLQSHIDGYHPDLVPVQAEQEVEQPHSMFDYHRTGYENPQRLVVCGNMAHLDGHKLSPQEVSKLHENVKAGKATLRHVVQNVEDKIAKMEDDLVQALGHVRRAVSEGSLHPDVLRTINRQIFTDSLVPTIGNKKAYSDFLTRTKPGVHIALDMNRFGKINKELGFEHGDRAIKAAFTAVREAMDETVGRKNGKAFRVGGDEGRLFVPSVAHATAFARSLREKLEKLPPVGGIHHLSASIGIGSTPEEADQASIHAKKKFNDKMHPHGAGSTETHVWGT